MQKGGQGVQISCKTAYVINGRPLFNLKSLNLEILQIYWKIDMKFIAGSVVSQEEGRPGTATSLFSLPR